MRRKVALAVAVAVPVLVLALLAHYHTTPAPQRHRTAHAQLPAAARTTYLGVYEHQEHLHWEPYAQFGHTMRVRLRLALYYSGWPEGFQSGFARQAWAAGTVTMVQIDPTNIPLRSIAAGRWDGFIRGYAIAVRNFGHPVVIGFGHEMNGGWYSWGRKRATPAAFVAAWRHIVNVFRAAGADNVTWLWTVNHVTPGSPDPAPWWPGAKYVTWVGVDGYYSSPSDTFGGVFGSALADVRALTSKPVLLSETGIGQVAGQAAKLPNMLAGVHNDHLLGLVWFDVAQNGSPTHQDWRLEGHPAAVTVFRRGVRQLLGA